MVSATLIDFYFWEEMIKKVDISALIIKRYIKLPKMSSDRRQNQQRELRENYQRIINYEINTTGIG